MLEGRRDAGSTGCPILAPSLSSLILRALEGAGREGQSPKNRSLELEVCSVVQGCVLWMERLKFPGPSFHSRVCLG